MRFNCLKSLVIKSQSLKTLVNNTVSLTRSTEMPYECVTTIETIVKNLYHLTNFYRLVTSADISSVPSCNLCNYNISISDPSKCFFSRADANIESSLASGCSWIVVDVHLT